MVTHQRNVAVTQRNAVNYPTSTAAVATTVAAAAAAVAAVHNSVVRGGCRQ